jgi:hypothetical protein
MDSTPLHPNIQPLDANALRNGIYQTAIPYQRRMLRTKFACRVISVICSLLIFGLVGSQKYDLGFLGGWLEGGLVSGLCLGWSTGDLVYLGLQYRKSKRYGVPITKDSWGPPGVHVSVQLIIWLLAIVMDGLEFMNYRWLAAGSYYYGRYREGILSTQVAIVCFMFFLS